LAEQVSETIFPTVARFATVASSGSGTRPLYTTSSPWYSTGVVKRSCMKVVKRSEVEKLLENIRKYIEEIDSIEYSQDREWKRRSAECQESYYEVMLEEDAEEYDMDKEEYEWRDEWYVSHLEGEVGEEVLIALFSAKNVNEYYERIEKYQKLTNWIVYGVYPNDEIDSNGWFYSRAVERGIEIPEWFVKDVAFDSDN
jgi:hypothetical protein